MATSAYVVGAVYQQRDGSPWYVAGSGYGNIQLVFEGDTGTFETTSMGAGGFQIQLPPGTYRETGGNLPAPLVCDAFVVGDDNVALDFVYPTDRGRVPVAANDAFVTDVSGASTLHVLANDRDADGTLDVSTLTIVTGPTSGIVQLDGVTGRVTYRPDDGFSGLDRFVYQVQDDDALTSNAATVRIVVTELDGTPWTNPVNRLDVNVDESVSAVDALQVINALNAGQGGVLQVPPAADDRPPPLLDVTGDNMLSPRDALVIINYLTRDGSGEGESAGRAERRRPRDRHGTWGPVTAGSEPHRGVRQRLEEQSHAFSGWLARSPLGLGWAGEWDGASETVGREKPPTESVRVAGLRAGRIRGRVLAADERRDDLLFGDWPQELAGWQFIE